jgi:fucose permease
LVRVFTRDALYLSAVSLSLVGSVLYVFVGGLSATISGLAVLGLGVALLYPLALGGAVDAAGADSTRAATRLMIAVGLAILLMPGLLGYLADSVGLYRAHYLIPVLLLLAFGAYMSAWAVARV